MIGGCVREADGQRQQEGTACSAVKGRLKKVLLLHGNQCQVDSPRRDRLSSCAAVQIEEAGTVTGRARAEHCWGHGAQLKGGSSAVLCAGRDRAVTVSQPMEPAVGAHYSSEKTSWQTSCPPGVGGDGKTGQVIRNSSKNTLGDVNYSWCLLRDLAANVDAVGKGCATGR